MIIDVVSNDQHPYILLENLTEKYLTKHQDITGKANKSDAETWTFTLEDGTTVEKKVVLVP